MLSLFLGLGFITLAVLPSGYISFYLLQKLENQIEIEHGKQYPALKGSSDPADFQSAKKSELDEVSSSKARRLANAL